MEPLIKCTDGISIGTPDHEGYHLLGLSCYPLGTVLHEETGVVKVVSVTAVMNVGNQMQCLA